MKQEPLLIAINLTNLLSQNSHLAFHIRNQSRIQASFSSDEDRSSINIPKKNQSFPAALIGKIPSSVCAQLPSLGIFNPRFLDGGGEAGREFLASFSVPKCHDTISAACNLESEDHNLLIHEGPNADLL